MNTTTWLFQDNMWSIMRLHERGEAVRTARAPYQCRHPERATFACCKTNPIISSGTISIIIGLLSVIYSTFEMHRNGEFYDKGKGILVPSAPATSDTNGSRTNSTTKAPFTDHFDKYGSPVTAEKYLALLGNEQADKGLCVTLTFLSVIHVVSSALLIRGAKLSDKRGFVPWIFIVMAMMITGNIYIMFNIVTMDFNSTVNFILFVWIVACVIEFHCLKSVIRAYKGRTSNERAIREGMAIFDARQLPNDVFTITSGVVQATETPVRIVLKPPTYDEAIRSLEDLGPPPDPPDEDSAEKPPEYSP